METDSDGRDNVIALLGGQVGLWRWDLATDRVQWSDHLLEMLGLDRADYREHFSFFESTLHPDDTNMWQDQFAAHMETGEPFRFRCRLRRKDGTYITTLAQAASLRDETGRPTELIGTAIDVTQEIEATALRLESERSFVSLAENVPGAIFRYLWRPDGSDAIEYMSAGCQDIWEINATGIQGDPSKLWDSVFDEDLAAMRASVAESAKDLSKWHHTWRIRTPTGIVKHLEGRGTPARLEDGTILWNSLILDVSEEARVREELVQQQEMLGQAQKMEAIGRIAGGISHDFNNLLAIIMGNAELAGELARNGTLRDFMQEIVIACERGSELTRRLLSFARRSRLDPRVSDVNASIRQIGSMIARVLPETIEMETILASGLWKTEVDVSFLESAVLNLCINARDAMPDGGRLTVETCNMRVSEDYIDDRQETLDPGRYVMIAVSDTGEGIPTDRIPLVTEPFFSTKGPDLGSGLGLAMVEGFARQSSGALRIYSEVDVGTTVKMFLPATDSDIRMSAPTTRGASQPTKPDLGRVLIVEDEPSVLRILASTLSAAGYLTEVATYGDAALLEYSKDIKNFDVLLTDVVMPGRVQGPELARRFKAIAPGLQVVFMSGYPNEAAINGNGLRANDRFLMKPVARARLLEIIADACDQNTRSAPE